ncbi:Hypp8777 [Branchiostoma lanceolatum]|uniref:Hypp8777 protein n=1 Tax=Branchiostoma lanceolatum TaxID=7740 RepID=A0A8J9ZA58_BRALA|nr:Hypp8777 [Branchiostoma lanceolatum]
MLRCVVRNIFTPFGHQCRGCERPLRLRDVDTKTYHLKCPMCDRHLWCIADGCWYCVQQLDRPWVNKADTRH